MLTATEWHISNFKSIEYASVPLKRLVALTGANSSGKSSILQSLLLLAQSTDDEVVLNGMLVRLGEARDVLRGGEGEVTFGYSLTDRNLPEGSTAQEWSFDITFAEEGKKLVVCEFYGAVDGEPVLVATRERVTQAVRDELADAFGVSNDILRVKEVGGKIAPARTYLSFRGFHPEALLVRASSGKILRALRKDFGSTSERSSTFRYFRIYEGLLEWAATQESSVGERLAERMDSLFANSGASGSETDTGAFDEFLGLYAQAAEREGWIVRRFDTTRRRYSDATHLTDAAIAGIANSLVIAVKGLDVVRWGLPSLKDSIRYLGPLREEPHVVSTSGSRNRNLPTGKKGEYTADLLVLEKNKEVTYCDWKKTQFKEPLPVAVSKWVTYLGVGEYVAVKDQGKLGRGLVITVNGVERDLTMVGVGASQLLPVIAMVLSVESGSVVCIEQPELHLHPAVQSRLADFFLFARPDISIVVETHSEYMITRLRRRVAENPNFSNDISINFALQEEGATYLSSLEISDTGNLSDWPAGFFDTQDIESRQIIKTVSEKIGRTE